jgi:predicted TIM-barrel fold metal-dependent hydrolase
MRDWTPEKSLEDMDRAGVATSILSVTIPGVWLGDVEKSRQLTRACNEYGARLVTDHPGRFGMFPALPLPDVEGSLREIEYVLDVLKADGIGLLTSYGDKWLGDPAFDPVMAELNRRKAVVYTHPHGPMCTHGILKEIVIRDSSIEYGTDTTRALVNMLFGGTFGRCPDLKIIWSHGGGTMPFLVERFIRMGKEARYKELMPHGFVAEARKFFYDTAQVLHGAPLLALKHLVPLAQICFGTDYPWRYSDECVNGLIASGAFSAEELTAIDNNAAALFPRFR